MVTTHSIVCIVATFIMLFAIVDYGGPSCGAAEAAFIDDDTDDDGIGPFRNPLPVNSTMYVALVVDTILIGMDAVAESRRMALEAALADRHMTVSYENILLRDLNTSAAIGGRGLHHVFVQAPSFSMDIPRMLLNVTFTFLFDVPESLLLNNTNVMAHDKNSMGMFAGSIAATAVRKKRIAVWYGPFDEGVRLGVDTGMDDACRDCTLLTYGLCSEMAQCPGEYEQASSSAFDADVIIIVSIPPEVLLRRIFAWNNEHIWDILMGIRQMKFTLFAGDELSGMPESVHSSPYHIGTLSQSHDDFIADVNASARGMYHSSIRTLLYTFRKGGLYRTLFGSGQNLSYRYPLPQLLKSSGYIPPLTDALSRAKSLDSSVVPPFIPVGRVAGALPRHYTLSNYFPTAYAARCVVNDRVITVDTDLAVLYGYRALTSEFIAMRLDVYSPAMYANASVDASRQMTYPIRYNVSNMSCSPSGTTGFILSGGVRSVVDDSGAVTGTVPNHDVFYLGLNCPGYDKPYYCDSFMLTNMTDSRVGVFAGETVGMRGEPLPSVPNATLYLTVVRTVSQDDDGNTVTVVKQVGRIVHRTQFTMLAEFDVFPSLHDQEVPTTWGEDQLQFMFWESRLGAFVALDSARKCIVTLPIAGAVDEVSVRLVLESLPSVWGVRWTDATAPIPSILAEDVLCVFYNWATSRYAAVVVAPPLSAGSSTNNKHNIPTSSHIAVLHYSFYAQQWFYAGAMVDGGASATNSSLNLIDFTCTVLDVGGGGALLVPRSSAADASKPDVNDLALIMYPTLPVVCDGHYGTVMDEAQVTCETCASGFHATPDGFCATPPSLMRDRFAAWEITVLVVGLAMSLVIGIPMVLWSVTKSKSSLNDKAKQERNAPPSGPCFVMHVALSEADTMWATANDSSDDDNDVENQGVGKGSERRPRRSSTNSSRGHNKVHELIADFHETLCHSTAANDCYLSSFHGERATVVSTSAPCLLMVAAEVTLNFAFRDPPVRIGSGLHRAFLLQVTPSSAVVKQEAHHRTLPAPNICTWLCFRREKPSCKYTYSGSGVHAALKLCNASLKGRIMATDTFMETVGSDVLKRIGVVRGATVSVQVCDSSVISAQEFTIGSISHSFDSTTALGEARARKRQLVRERRQRTQIYRNRAPSVPPPLPSASSITSPTDELPPVRIPPVGCDPGAQSQVQARLMISGRQHLQLDVSHRSMRHNEGAAQHATLVQLATLLGRTLLTKLANPSNPSGAKALEVISKRLHLQSSTWLSPESSMNPSSTPFIIGSSGTVPVTTLKAFGLRISEMVADKVSIIAGRSPRNNSTSCLPFRPLTGLSLSTRFLTVGRGSIASTHTREDTPSHEDDDDEPREMRPDFPLRRSGGSNDANKNVVNEVCESERVDANKQDTLLLDASDSRVVIIH